MRCVNCETITPAHYKVCPECKGELVREKFAPQAEEIEIVEVVSPYVEMGEIDDFGF